MSLHSGNTDLASELSITHRKFCSKESKEKKDPDLSLTSSVTLGKTGFNGSKP